MIREADDWETKVEPPKAPKTLEDGGQATIDELKELNLVTREDPHPIYVRTILTPKEDEQYFHLSSKYRMYFHRATRKCLV